jgi:hypothetical protein
MARERKTSTTLTTGSVIPPSISDLYTRKADEWAARDEWAPTKGSTNVAAVRYDVNTDSLKIQFKSGITYTYNGHGPAFAKECFSASSIGTFVWVRIRNAGIKHDLMSPPGIVYTEAIYVAEQEAKKEAAATTEPHPRP